jgi:hypothetical protein
MRSEDVYSAASRAISLPSLPSLKPIPQPHQTISTVSDKVRVMTLKVTLKKGEREGEGLDFPSQTLERPRRPEGVSLGPHHPYKIIS